MRAPQLSPLIGSLSPEAQVAAVEAYAREVSHMLAGRVEMPDVSAKGAPIGISNLAVWPAVNTFTVSDEDLFFPHDAGRPLPRFWVVDLDAKIDGPIYRVRAPNSKGTYLRCPFSEPTIQVKAVVLMFSGQEA